MKTYLSNIEVDYYDENLGLKKGNTFSRYPWFNANRAMSSHNSILFRLYEKKVPIESYTNQIEFKNY
jgi:hypothetical protein